MASSVARDPAPPPTPPTLTTSPRPLWQRLLPGVATLRRYERSWLRGDLLAGITVAAYLVPQVMAYAVVAGLPPVTGLWAIIGPLTVYAIFGSSRCLSVGPESTSALMTAAAIAALVGAAAPPERRMQVAGTLAIAVGIICLIGFVARLGFLADLLSKPVLVGYMSGIAVLMIVSQLGKITRLPVAGDMPAEQLGSLAGQIARLHWPSLILAVVVIAFLLVLNRLRPGWPGSLIAIVLSTVVVLFLPSAGIRLVGDIPAGLPPLSLPSLAGLDPGALAVAAVGIAVVGYSDNALTARAFADNHEQSIDANQEFLALGAANLAAGLSSGFPVSSSGSRTVLGDGMGARTQLYSLVALAGVIATMFLLGPALAHFPFPALGAVVIYAAIRLIDVAEWRRIARFRRSELILALLTTVAVLGVGVLAGIGIAIALSLLDLLRRLAKPHDGILGYVPGLAGMHDIDDYPTARQVPGLVVYRYDSPLFFVNAENFVARALRAVEDAPSTTHWFLLNAEANVEIDLTAVDALRELRRRLAEAGVAFAMARVKQDLRDQLLRAGFVDEVGADRIFPTLPTAVAGYRAWHAATLGGDIELPQQP